jgi:ribosomal protein S12 methylthiotransferase accessory factor
MGRGASPLLCRISTLAEVVEWRALRRRRALPGYRRSHQDAVPGALRIEDLLAHIATAGPDALRRIKAGESAQHWVDGFSLLHNHAVPVPLEYIHGLSGTNGLAAGNRIEEAIVQGACEVFERRAAITVVKNRLVVPTFDAATIRHPVLLRQLEALRAAGVEVVLKDLSFGGALPCVGAYFVRPGLPEERQAHHLFKAAASFDREAALMSCLTEFAQVARLGEGGRGLGRDDERLLARDEADNFLPLFWFGYVPYRRAEFLRAGEVIPFVPDAVTGDLLEDIRHAGEICRMLDKDLIAVDLTDPAIGFPVVQVVIPGYSDILPYHPAASPVLFEGWTRHQVMGSWMKEDGTVAPLTASALFPDLPS